MRIQRRTWTQTDGFGYRQARQGLSRSYATWPCKQPANGKQVAAVRAWKQGKRRFTRGHLKWRMPMSSGLEAKMTQISWNRKIFFFFFCSAQETTCILCKLDWKDTANFIRPMLLLTGQGQQYCSMILDLCKTPEFTVCNHFLTLVLVIHVYVPEFDEGLGILWLASGWTTAPVETCKITKGTFLTH